MNAKPSSLTIQSTKDAFDDAHDIALLADEGPTFHKWGTQPNRERIDYIMISKGASEVSEYRIVDNCHNGVYSSDHSSIYIKVKLK
jgi:endonuclease/exonuclease/phosphatase family metal-dependent hydrolase